MEKIAGERRARGQKQETLFSEALFHVTPKHHEKIHIADQMYPAGVKQQRRYYCQASVTKWVCGNKTEPLNDLVQIAHRQECHEHAKTGQGPREQGKVLQGSLVLFDGISEDGRYDFPVFIGWNVRLGLSL